MEDLGARAEQLLAQLGQIGARTRKPAPRVRPIAKIDEDLETYEIDPPPLSVQRTTANPKIAPVRVEFTGQGRKRFVGQGPFAVTTYVSIAATCPKDCRFFDNGCYASAGQSHLTVGRLNETATRWSVPWSALEVSFAEAEAIERLWPYGVPQDGRCGGRDLRLHVSGEVSCTLGARALGASASRWRSRGGGRCWTYTHRWGEISRSAWTSSISVLASVESGPEAEVAIARGYVPSIVVPVFPAGRKVFSVPGSSTRFVPCLNEAGARVTCVECRLCLDDEALRTRGLGIAFAVHGSDSQAARRVLPVVA
jgi:hypothetical protein